MERRRNEASALCQTSGFLPAQSPLVCTSEPLDLGLHVREGVP